MHRRNPPSRARPFIAVIAFAGLVGGDLCARTDEDSSAHVAAGPKAAEASRLSLLRTLIKQRAGLARAGKAAELRSCDARILRLPTPANRADAFARRLVGAWRSPRHDYLYRADGSWTLLSADRGTLHGRWRIAGNQLEVTSGYAKPETREKYTVIMLGKDDFVFADRETVFVDQRLR